MSVSSDPEREAMSEGATAPATDVAVLETCPGRSVFIEDGNCDGWISTDVTVDLER